VNLHDPIASTTLALLYVAQGHHRRARQVLDAVLARDPCEGHALQLQSRLRLLERAEVSVEPVGDHLQAQWRGAPAGAHAILVAFSFDDRGILRQWVTSVVCDMPTGAEKFPIPFHRGHGVCCLGGVDTHGRFVARTTSRPTHWG